MSETDRNSEESSRKHHSSSRRHSSSSSKKTTSSRLGGGRIDGGTQRSPGRSRSESVRDAQEKAHRSHRKRAEKPVVIQKEKPVKSRRSKPESRSGKTKEKKQSPFSAKSSWGRRLFSFTGFTYNRLTKKDTWTILRRFCIGAFPLLALACAAHAISLGSGRLWLDEQLLSRKSFINSTDGVLYSWLSVIEGEYAPLSWSTMWIEHFLWGSDGNGYHIFNLILHGLNTVFIWRLCRNLNLRLSTPWLAAAVFAVHPLCFPAVGWIYARPVILGTTLLLASLLAFSNYDKPNSDDLSPIWMLVSILGAVLASFCHAGLALIIAFLAVGIMGFRRGTKVNTGVRHIFRCLPLLISIVPGAAIAFILAVRTTSNPFSLSWLEQIQAGGWMAIRLPLHALWPPLSFFMPPFEPGNAVVAFLPLGILIFSLAVLFFLRRLPVFRPLFFLLWSWALIFFGMIMFSPRNASFNYGLTGTYLIYPATAVLAIALVSLVAGFFSLAGETKGAVGTNITGLTMVGFFLLSGFLHTPILKDSEAFWRQVVKRYPELPVGDEFLARDLVSQERYKDALPSLRRVIGLTPGNARMRKMLGQVLLRLGEAEEAETHLRKAFKMDPDLQDQDIEQELQKQLEAIGNNPESLLEFLNISTLPGHGESDILDYDQNAFTTHATSFGPKILQAVNLVKANQMREAGPVINELLKEDPRGAMGNYLAGYVAIKNQAFDKAVKHLRMALKSQPDLGGASFFLGVALREEKQYAESATMLGRALRLKPKMAPAYYQLGVTNEAMKLPKNALEFYRAAILIKQDHVPSLRACAEILATCPDPALRDGKQALSLAQKAVLYSSESDPELLMTLAAAYAEAGYFRDAVRTARRAVRKASAPELKTEAQRRLKAFQSGKSYRQSL